MRSNKKQPSHPRLSEANYQLSIVNYQLKLSSQHWYPIRVAYGRDERMLKLKEQLDALGIENFLPLRSIYERKAQAEYEKKALPAIHGLIFVRSSQEQLTELKMTRSEFAPMHYMMNRLSDSAGNHILTVPDRQMENFIQVASKQDERVQYLEYTDFLAKPGKRVRITDGDFKGAEGTIKRIKKRQCVVVQIEGLAAVAITFVPTAWLEPIE